MNSRSEFIKVGAGAFAAMVVAVLVMCGCKGLDAEMRVRRLE